jgi:putative transposase
MISSGSARHVKGLASVVLWVSMKLVMAVSRSGTDRKTPCFRRRRVSLPGSSEKRLIRGINRCAEQDRKAVAAALKAVRTAVDAEAAEAALAAFEDSDLARQYPAIAPSWRRAWNEVIPFPDYPPEVRRLIYTTNAIEALNSKIRRAVRTRGFGGKTAPHAVFQPASLPSDDAAAKLIHLALNAASQEWKRSVREWHAIKSQFAIMFEDRFPMA